MSEKMTKEEMEDFLKRRIDTWVLRGPDAVSTMTVKASVMSAWLTAEQAVTIFFREHAESCTVEQDEVLEVLVTDHKTGKEVLFRRRAQLDWTFVPVKVKCTDCYGNGKLYVDERNHKVCTSCNGTGQVPINPEANT
jgi:DnaJ-class molecular chaperone